MATFQLELVTPERILLSEQVRSVRVPGIEGSLGILSGHAPLMTALSVGMVKVTYDNGDEELIATSGGFVEVSKTKTIILADTAERAADIDIARAEAAVARAREHLASGAAVDYDEAAQALARATNRLKIAQQK
jgi:F-type H+-transporting ATPase subunit epsilon